MIWIVVPLIITLLLMEFYFGRYSQEELGWNTAFGNSIVLFFIAIDLFRHIFTTGTVSLFDPVIMMKLLVAALIGVEALWLMFMDFFHFLPEKIAFFISSSLPNNITAYIALAVVYSNNIPFDLTTIVAAIIMFIVLYFFFKIIKWIEPKGDKVEVKVIKKKVASKPRKGKK